MKIKTSVHLNASPEQVWPLLTNSQMRIPGWFCLGVPQPTACELPGQTGGVGAERRCISDRGTVTQRITHWEPPKMLLFEMLKTDHDWAPLVHSIKEQFVITPSTQGCILERTTTLRAQPPFRVLREFGFYFGLKRVHLYVFKNWKTQLKAQLIASP